MDDQAWGDEILMDAERLSAEPFKAVSSHSISKSFGDSDSQFAVRKFFS